MVGLLEREATVILIAHLLAVIPIGAFVLVTRMNPIYKVPSEQLARWWAWFALIIVATAILGTAVAQ